MNGSSRSAIRRDRSVRAAVTPPTYAVMSAPAVTAGRTSARIRVTSASVALSDGPVLGIARQITTPPSVLTIGADTSSMPSVAASSAVIATRRGSRARGSPPASASPASSSSASSSGIAAARCSWATMASGPEYPGPKDSRMMSPAWWAVVSSGRAEESTCWNAMDSIGVASASSSAEAPIANGHGCPVTTLAMRAHPPRSRVSSDCSAATSPAVTIRCSALGSTRRPINPISAGTSVSAASSARATTIAAE